MNYLNSVISAIVVFIHDHHDYFVQFSGAVAGSLVAFCFFIVGQYFLEHRKEKKDEIDRWKTVNEYSAHLFIPLQFNKDFLQNIVLDIKPLSLTLSRLSKFPTQDSLFYKFGNKKAVLKLLALNVELIGMNQNIDIINSWFDTMNHVSETAITSGHPEKFKDTFDSNILIFKTNAKKLIEQIILTENNLKEVCAEINFTIDVIASNFFKRHFIAFRIKANPELRKKLVEKYKKINNNQT